MYLRVSHEDEKFREDAEKEAEREQFKKDSVEQLSQFRGGI